MLQDTRLQATETGAKIDTNQPLDLQFYVGVTTRGGKTAYKPVKVTVEKYDPCLNADIYPNQTALVNLTMSVETSPFYAEVANSTTLPEVATRVFNLS